MEKKVLIKFLNGTADAAERSKVMQWLEKDGSREKFDRLLLDRWKNVGEGEDDERDYEALLNKIHARILRPSRSIRPNPWVRYLRVAASALLLMASAYFLKQSAEYTEPVPVISERIIERSTSDGEKLQLTLPDDSKVTLNANSTLSFSSHYGLKERVVRLSGEAFFEVAKDPEKPFRVETDGHMTRALGTKFNTYARSGNFAVALTEGKVAVQGAQTAIELQPGELARSSGSTTISVGPFDMDQVIGWKENTLVFDRKPLTTILEDLERWYGVEMAVDPGLNVNRRVIGTFRNKNLNDVLTGLGFSLGFAFDIDNNTVTISKNRL
ncbi:FecR family protein [Cyclobacterium lianum]|uniref:FecR family protein n=1 Tax=Cyclobacterium lianum TaxID=388280 RepID=A0A1M7PFQ2_9BACT|nr:FecR domain-containing protein [Cyclobacterium lianum]SHN15808.1 FecR family protein [Cyclobacterium lianum]